MNMIFENKKLLVGLLIILLVVSTVQSFFMVKLYNSVHQDASVNITKDLEDKSLLGDELLRNFDQQSWDPFEELQSMRERMDRMFDDSFNRFKHSPFFDNENKEVESAAF